MTSPNSKPSSGPAPAPPKQTPREFALELAAKYQLPRDTADTIVSRAELFVAFLGKG